MTLGMVNYQNLINHISTDGLMKSSRTPLIFLKPLTGSLYFDKLSEFLIKTSIAVEDVESKCSKK